MVMMIGPPSKIDLLQGYLRGPCFFGAEQDGCRE